MPGVVGFERSEGEEEAPDTGSVSVVGREVCVHSEDHVGYVLIETKSANTAVKVLQCMERYNPATRPATAPNRTQYLSSNRSRKTRARSHGKGALQTLQASLAHDSSFALAAAIRACSSRPQLIELLLPFLPSASPLIRDDVPLRTRERPAGGGKEGDGCGGGVLIEGDSGHMSKASAAVMDTLKGMQLDGETCALALRRLSALPVYPPVKPGESWHAKMRRAWREGPKMPPLVDPDWRPRVKRLFQLQVSWEF